jgi:membrane protease YdiL (CAAX protease family)
MMKQTSGFRPVSALRFFALTYLLSWLIWVPLAFSHFGVGPLRIPEGLSSGIRLLGVLMPAAAAISLTAAGGGRLAVRQLLARLLVWRVQPGWWLAAVGVFPALLLAAALLNRWLGGSPIPDAEPGGFVALLLYIVMLAIASLGEEIGWRGAALPALQRKHSPLRSSAILGFFWATWHLPFWLLLDSFDQFGPGYIGLNYLGILPMTAFITWFFNGSRSSLLLPVAFHLSFNILNVALLPVTLSVGAYALFIGIQWLAMVGIWGYRKFSTHNKTMVIAQN